MSHPLWFTVWVYSATRRAGVCRSFVLDGSDVQVKEGPRTKCRVRGGAAKRRDGEVLPVHGAFSTCSSFHCWQECTEKFWVTFFFQGVVLTRKAPSLIKAVLVQFIFIAWRILHCAWRIMLQYLTQISRAYTM